MAGACIGAIAGDVDRKNAERITEQRLSWRNQLEQLMVETHAPLKKRLENLEHDLKFADENVGAAKETCANALLRNSQERKQICDDMAAKKAAGKASKIELDAVLRDIADIRSKLGPSKV